MRALLSGLDTVECAYYLRPGPNCSLDFEALRAQKEAIRQTGKQEEGVVQLGGTEFLLSPNGMRVSVLETDSGYHQAAHLCRIWLDGAERNNVVRSAFA